MRKEPKRTTASSSMVETPKGTTLYRGQFAKMKTPKKTSNATKDDKSSVKKPEVPQDSTDKLAQVTNKPGKATKQKKSKADAPVKDSKSEKQVPAAPEHVPKKVAKKLAWKKRQMELKQQRVQLKKQKTAKD